MLLGKKVVHVAVRNPSILGMFTLLNLFVQHLDLARAYKGLSLSVCVGHSNNICPIKSFVLAPRHSETSSVDF